MAKYKKAIDISVNPLIGGIQSRESSLINSNYSSKKINKLVKDVLHNDDIDISLRIAEETSSRYKIIFTHRMIVKYKGQLIMDFPNKCMGMEDKAYAFGRMRTISASDPDMFEIGRYILAYLNTPKDRLLDLGTGPFGIYEILMAADKRISTRKISMLSLTFRSIHALQIIRIRCE